MVEEVCMYNNFKMGEQFPKARMVKCSKIREVVCTVCEYTEKHPIVYFKIV